MRRTATIAAICAVAAGMSPARAVPPAGRLVLSARSTASIDLTLDRAVDLDLRQATVSGRGRFQGFYVERVDIPAASRGDDSSTTGVVSLRDYHEPDAPEARSLSLGDALTAHLQPGRYRFYVLADGPSSVTIPGTGLRSRTLTAARPASASAVVEPDILQTPIQAQGREHLQAGARSVNLSSILVGRFRAYAGSIATCITPRGAECGEGTNTGVDGPFVGYMLSPLNSTSFSLTYVYHPGTVAVGAVDAAHQATDAATLQFAASAAFTLQLQG